MPGGKYRAVAARCNQRHCPGGAVSCRIAKLWSGRCAPPAGRYADYPSALFFTLGLSVFTTILFGFIPAWRLSHVSPQACLKESAQTGTSRGSLSLQNSIAIGEIALALALLIGGSLLHPQLSRACSQTPLGFDPAGVFVVRTIFDTPRYPEPAQRIAVQKELLERLAALPGVTRVAAASHLPLSDERGIGFHVEHAAADEFHFAQNSLVSPGYFGAMGIRLLAGRDFTTQDAPGTMPVAIISESMAREYFHRQDPMGQRFEWGDRGFFTIIGVAEDVHISALDADPPPMIYQAMFQMQTWTAGRTAFVLRTDRDRAGILQRSATTGVVARQRFAALQQHHAGDAGLASRWGSGASPCCCWARSRSLLCCWRPSGCSASSPIWFHSSNAAWR